MSLSDSWTDRQPRTSRMSAAEAVLADLRHSIEESELSVGTKLPSEAALATRYSVSRSVVREALRSTNALGLTETRTGRGTFVVADRVQSEPVFGRYTVQALREARPHIEVPAAGLAASRRTEEQLERLRTLVSAMDVVNDPAEWVRLDGEFHLCIARSSGNVVFASVVDDIREALAEQSKLLNTIPRRREASGAEHRAIVDAIAEGSPERASAAMADHLLIVEDAVSRLLA
jgi:GntR family transcriptional regulator, transcriptional repressor for pyruvate dehydrogenase complex